jgi:hypothetical protein
MAATYLKYVMENNIDLFGTKRTSSFLSLFVSYIVLCLCRYILLNLNDWLVGDLVAWLPTFAMIGNGKQKKYTFVEM